MPKDTGMNWDTKNNVFKQRDYDHKKRYYVFNSQTRFHYRRIRNANEVGKKRHI